MSRLGCLFWLWSYRSFFVYSFSRKIKILYKLWYLLTAPQSSVCLFSQNIFRSGNVLFTFIDGGGDLWWAGCRFLSIILHLVVYSFICTPFMKMSHGNKSIIAFNMQLQSHRKSDGMGAWTNTPCWNETVACLSPRLQYGSQTCSCFGRLITERSFCVWWSTEERKRCNLTSQCFGLDLCETFLSANLGLKCFLLFLPQSLRCERYLRSCLMSCCWSNMVRGVDVKCLWICPHWKKACHR